MGHTVKVGLSGLLQFGAAVALIGVLFCVLNIFWLNNSLQALLHGALSQNYKILSRKIETLGSDSGAFWHVTFDQSFNIRPDQIAFLGIADSSDQSYYKARFAAAFNLPEVYFSDYKLLRGELQLGNWTICARSHCNLEILIHKDGNNAFVGISNI